MKNTYSIRMDDLLRARLNSVSKKTGYSVSKVVWYLINHDRTLEDLEKLLSPYDEEDGVDETFLIKHGIIIIK